MKITGVRVESYKWPRKRPISNGLHTYTHSGVGFVFIDTDEGVTGIGIGASSGGVIGAAIEHFTPMLIGEDPIAVERLWHKLWVPKLVGRRGLTTRAISAIDIALWDLRAKVAGMPLYKLLGGFRQRVPTYIAGGYYEDGKGLKELQEELAGHVEAGARAVKMKIGAVPIPEDVARVKAAREAVGPDIKLMIDANCAYRCTRRCSSPNGWRNSIRSGSRSRSPPTITRATGASRRRPPSRSPRERTNTPVTDFAI